MRSSLGLRGLRRSMLVAVAGSVGVGCSVLLGIDGIEYGSSGDAADGQQDVRGLDSTTDAGADGDGDGDASEAEASCDGCGPKLLRVAAGPYHACVLRSDGYVYCWGYNGYYGLGSSQIVAGTCPGNDYCVPTPSLVLGIADVIDIAAGWFFTCALTRARDVWCWGRNIEGQLGIGAGADAGAKAIASPGRVPLAGPAKQVIAGTYHACAVLMSGGVQCWGLNTYGQLGDGTPLGVLRASPGNVLLPEGGAFLNATIGPGAQHVCALRDDGKVYCWGLNEQTQLGRPRGGLPQTDAGHAYTLLPLAVLDTGLTPMVFQSAATLSASGLHTCIELDGGGECWGYDLYGELGRGGVSSALEPAPAPISVVPALKAVIAGQTTGYGVDDQGKLWAWGDNGLGQLGRGDLDGGTCGLSTCSPAAVRILVPVRTRHVSAGGDFAIAIGEDDSVWAWGVNTFAQLGRVVGQDAGDRICGVDAGVHCSPVPLKIAVPLP